MPRQMTRDEQRAAVAALRDAARALDSTARYVESHTLFGEVDDEGNFDIMDYDRVLDAAMRALPHVYVNIVTVTGCYYPRVEDEDNACEIHVLIDLDGDTVPNGMLYVRQRGDAKRLNATDDVSDVGDGHTCYRVAYRMHPDDSVQTIDITLLDGETVYAALEVELGADPRFFAQLDYAAQRANTDPNATGDGRTPFTMVYQPFPNRPKEVMIVTLTPAPGQTVRDAFTACTGADPRGIVRSAPHNATLERFDTQED